MPFIVIYDANVLYPNTLRDLLIRIAEQPHLVQAKWTTEILDEMSRALRKTRPDITEEKTARLCQLMNDAVRDCLVTARSPLEQIGAGSTVARDSSKSALQCVAEGRAWVSLVTGFPAVVVVAVRDRCSGCRLRRAVGMARMRRQ